MGVTLTWSQGTVRAGANHNKYGDDYDLVVSIVRIKDDAFLFGAKGHLSLSDYRELIKMLKAQGVKTINWDRARGKIINKKLGK